jgi:hypothetical protein
MGYDVRYIDYRKFPVNGRGHAWLTNLAEERPMVTSRRRVFTSQNLVLMKRMAEQGFLAPEIVRAISSTTASVRVSFRASIPSPPQKQIRSRGAR